MKKIISILLCVILSTATVYAAVPETVGGRKIYTTAVAGRSNIDAGGDKGYAGSISYQVVGSVNLERVLKYPDNPEAAGDYCVKHMYNDSSIQNRLMTPSTNKYTNSVWTTTFDLKVEGPLQKIGSSFKLDETWVGLSCAITPEGIVTFGGNGYDNVVYEDFKADNWYNFTYIIDVINDKFGVVIKDLESDEPEVVSELFSFYDKNGEIYDIGAVSYMEMRPIIAGQVLYTDDVETVIYAYAPEITEAYGIDEEGNRLEDGVDFNKPYIALAVNGKINDTTLESDSIIMKLGNKEIPSSFVYEAEKDLIVVKPAEKLLPNTEYQIDFSEDIKSSNGIAFEKLSYSAKTMREYYSIGGIETTEITPGNEFKVSVTINNKENIESTDSLVVAVYDEEGALCSVNALPLKNTADKEAIKMTVKASETYKVSRIDAILMKSLTEQCFVDVYSILIPAE